MPAPTVFVSYSHRDRAWMERVTLQLRVLERQGTLSIWQDRQIRAGRRWRSEIFSAMEEARVAVLLVTAHALASAFIIEEELPFLLRRRDAGHLTLVPLLLNPCPWTQLLELAELQVYPTDGQPLALSSEVQQEVLLAELAVEIGELLGQGAATAPAADAWEPPPLLPYLVDREPQGHALITALKRLREGPNRPFVGLVHGEVDQGHEEYRERLQRDLASLLRHREDAADPRDIPFHWPSGAGSRQEMGDRLTQDLARRITGDALAPVEKIQAQLALSPTPVLLHAHLFTEDLLNGGPAGIDHFLAFWQDWPELGFDQRLMVVLFIKYQTRVARPGTATSFWGTLFSSPTRRAQKLSRANQALRRTLERLDLAAMPRLVGAVLPELHKITQNEADDWARSEGKRFCDPKLLLREIHDLFSSEGPGLPMQRLAAELKRFLIQHHRPEEVRP